MSILRSAAAVASLALAMQALLVAPASVAAQLPELSGGVTLQAALDATISHSSQVQLEERQVQLGLGALLTARAPFDAELTTSLTSERESGVTPVAGRDISSVLTSTLTYALGVPKRLRSGIVLTPQVALTRVDVASSSGGGVGGAGGAPINRATVKLGILVPLLQDRGGAVTAAPEREAESAYEASILDARHATAASALGATVAYWNELAAEQRLQVYRSSEDRARQLVDETETLVAADERPAADLQQLLANLALKRAVRIAGEQAEIEARQQLALAMGVYGGGIAVLPRALTAFPNTPPDSVAAVAAARAATGEDLALVLHRRADLGALTARRSAAEAQLAAARSGRRPRLDLAVEFGYAGLAAEGSVDGAFSSFYRNVRGVNASVQLSYALPLARLAARGVALQSAATYDQARIRQGELVRQIESGVLVAREALQHSRLALRASHEATALSRRVVENEKRKFQLGMSTLFDVILAEDALTTARLGEIVGQHDYAVAIARLRYESGTLLTVDGRRVTVSARSITTPP